MARIKGSAFKSDYLLSSRLMEFLIGSLDISTKSSLYVSRLAGVMRRVRVKFVYSVETRPLSLFLSLFPLTYHVPTLSFRHRITPSCCITSSSSLTQSCSSERCRSSPMAQVSIFTQGCSLWVMDNTCITAGCIP